MRVPGGCLLERGPRGAPGLPAGTGTDRRCPGCQACVDGRAGASAAAAPSTAATSLPGERRTPWAPRADALVSRRSVKGLFWVETSGRSQPWMVLPPYAGPGSSTSAPRAPPPLPGPAFSVWLGVVAGRAWPVPSLLVLVAQREEEGAVLGTGWLEMGLGGRTGRCPGERCAQDRGRGG